MQRILTRARGKTEEYVANEINQLCLEPFRGKLAVAHRQPRLSCGSPLSVRLIPVAMRVAGCPGG